MEISGLLGSTHCSDVKVGSDSVKCREGLSEVEGGPHYIDVKVGRDSVKRREGLSALT